MGDYASRKKPDNAATISGAPGMEAFWAGVSKGATPSLVDPRVPGTAADPTALLPYIDRDHDDDPVAMATKVTAHLNSSAAQAKTFTRAKAQPYVDALIAAMDHTDEREGHHRMLNALDRLDDPALRETVLAKFQAQTGRRLADVIETSTWHGARDKAQAQALISPARANTEREIEALSPAKRAKLQAEARKTATEIANVIGRDSPEDSAHALHRALAGKTPAQIEAIRAAVREQSLGNESLYEQIDRSLSGGDEDEAIASLTGDPVYTASVALQNASGDAPRIVEILGALKPGQIENLKKRFPAATFAWMSVAPDQRAEIGALVNDNRANANGAKVADLLRDEFHGVAMEGPGLDKQSQHNREVRTTANLLRELEKMSASDLAAARDEWDNAAPQRNEKTWDAMIEERFGSDPLMYMRVRALASGNKVESTALALSQGLRDHDQSTIDAALANPELSSSDPEKRAAARKHAAAVAARVQEIDANKQGAMAAMTGGDVASVRGENLDTQLAAHYTHVATTQHFESASDVTDFAVAPDEQAMRRRKRAHAAEVGTDELRETGTFSTATAIHRARDNGDTARVATILEDQRDRDAVGDVSLDYKQKYGEQLFQQLDSDEVDAYRDFKALYGVEVSHDDAEYAMRDSIENRVATVHTEGPNAVRSNETRLRIDRRERDKQKSDAHAGSELMNQVVFGRAAGSEQRVDWALANEAAAVDGPRDEFDQQAAHTRSMSDMQREEKIAMAERAARWISIAGKLLALATLNPLAMTAIDALTGFASIYVKGDIQGEAYKTAGADLLDLGITVLNDLTMIPIAKLESTLVRTAVTLGLSSATIVVRNDLGGRGAETTIDLIKNILLSLVINPAGDHLAAAAGNGRLGKALNAATNTLGGLATNGADGGLGVLEELAGNMNGMGAKGHPHAATHHADRPAHLPIDHSRHPDTIASGHYAESDHAHTPERIASHMHPVERAQREAYFEEHGHTGTDLHSHFMGVASVDDFAAFMGTPEAPMDREQMLQKMADAVRNDPDYVKHYSVNEAGEKVFDSSGGGIDPIKGGHAFDNVHAMETAIAEIDELRKHPPTPETDAKIRRIASEAVDHAMNSSQHTPYDGAYSIRDTMVKAYIDPQTPEQGVNAYRNFTRMTLEALARDGILYSEQSQSVKKLSAGNVPYDVVRDEMERFNTERAMRGEPPIDLRFLAMIETRFLGAEGSGSAGTEADWKKQLDAARNLVKRGDVMGVDFASPERSDMGKGGKQLETRFEQLAMMLAEEGKAAGRKLTLRPHVGEGYIEMPNDPATGNRELFDRDHSAAHYDKARSNLDALIANVDRLTTTKGPDGKPIYDPENPAFEIRFGHATHATPEQAQAMARLGIKVEVNLGSNAISGSLQDSKTKPQGRSHEGHLHSMDDHSLLSLAAGGVEVHLATDAQAVMRTRLKTEYKRAADILNIFRGDPADGRRGKGTMPVTRETFLAARPDVDPTTARAPYQLGYDELPQSMKSNIDTAYERMIENSMQRQSEVDAGDAADRRRDGVS